MKNYFNLGRQFSNNLDLILGATKVLRRQLLRVTAAASINMEVDKPSTASPVRFLPHLQLLSTGLLLEVSLSLKARQFFSSGIN